MDIEDLPREIEDLKTCNNTLQNLVDFLHNRLILVEEAQIESLKISNPPAAKELIDRLNAIAERHGKYNYIY